VLKAVTKCHTWCNQFAILCKICSLEGRTAKHTSSLLPVVVLADPRVVMMWKLQGNKTGTFLMFTPEASHLVAVAVANALTVFQTLLPDTTTVTQLTMALPLPAGLTPMEVAFLCEMEMVTVIPRQRLESLDLLGVSSPVYPAILPLIRTPLSINFDGN
jgi:hypothetical protein